MLRYIQQLIVQPEACVSNPPRSAPRALKYNCHVVDPQGAFPANKQASKGTCQIADEAQLARLDARLARAQLPRLYSCVRLTRMSMGIGRTPAQANQSSCWT